MSTIADMVHSINDKVFLITGAASGIGAALVKAFLEEGAKHIAVLDISETSGKSFEQECNEKYGGNKVKFFKCDVTQDDELFYAYDTTAAEQGYIDVVINNAGIMNDNEQSFKKEVEINVTALATSTFKAWKMMRQDKGGRGGTIINISSIAALSQDIILPLYFATKSAVLQFSNCLGLEDNYKVTGIRVLAVCFGPTDTALFHDYKIGSYDDNIEQVLKDSEILKTVAYLQSIETPVKCVLEAYKYGKSGGTWLGTEDQEPIDYSETVKKAYEILNSGPTEAKAKNPNHPLNRQNLIK